MPSAPPPPGGSTSEDPYGSSSSGSDTSGAPGSSSQAAPGDEPYQSAPGYYGGSAPSDQDNNLGVIALVTGILSLVVCQPIGIAAIIYGRRAQAAQRAGTATNGTLGAVGFWLGVAALVVFVVVAVGFLAFLTIMEGGTEPRV